MCKGRGAGKYMVALGKQSSSGRLHCGTLGGEQEVDSGR